MPSILKISLGIALGLSIFIVGWAVILAPSAEQTSQSLSSTSKELEKTIQEQDLEIQRQEEQEERDEVQDKTLKDKAEAEVKIGMGPKQVAGIMGRYSNRQVISKQYGMVDFTFGS